MLDKTTQEDEKGPKSRQKSLRRKITNSLERWGSLRRGLDNEAEPLEMTALPVRPPFLSPTHASLPFCVLSQVDLAQDPHWMWQPSLELLSFTEMSPTQTPSQMTQCQDSAKTAENQQRHRVSVLNTCCPPRHPAQCLLLYCITCFS